MLLMLLCIVMQAPPARRTKAQILRCFLATSFVLLPCNCLEQITDGQWGLSASACAAVVVKDPTHCVSINTRTDLEFNVENMRCDCTCPIGMITDAKWRYIPIDGSAVFYDPEKHDNVDPRDISSYTCTTCEDGTHLLDAEDSSCTACPEGKFTAEPGSPCIDCFDGGSAQVIVVDNVCTCSAGNIKQGGTCVECDGGKYSGGTVCLDCQPGKYNPSNTGQYGKAQCLPCGAGRHVENDGKQCVACDGGKYSNGTLCESCQPGKYNPSNTGLDGKAECWVCGAGWQVENDGKKCVACDGGKYSDGTGCESCQPGKYNPTNTGQNGKTECLVCIAGSKVQNEGKECVACPSGTYGSNNHTCMHCPHGHYIIGEGKAGLSSCTAISCADGYFQDGAVCSPCGAGRQVIDYKCVSCRGASYSTGLANCTQCPLGKNTRGDGKEAPEDCIVCAVGQYANVETGWCTECPAGKSTTKPRPGTTSEATGVDTCKECLYSTGWQDDVPEKCLTDGISDVFRYMEYGEPVRDSLEASREAQFEDWDRLRSFLWKRMVLGFAVRIDQGAVRSMNSVVLRRCWEQVYATRIDYKTVDAGGQIVPDQTKTGWQYQRTWCPANINPKHTRGQTYTLIFPTGNHASWQINTAQCCGERSGDHNAATYADWEQGTVFPLLLRDLDDVGCSADDSPCTDEEKNAGWPAPTA